MDKMPTTVEIVLVVGLLALMGFCGEANKGWQAGLKNIAMFLLAITAYFCMVFATAGALSYYLNNMGGWEMLHGLDAR